MVKVNVSYKDKQLNSELYVVPNYGSPNMGRCWIRKLNINFNEIFLLFILNLFSISRENTQLQMFPVDET